MLDGIAQSFFALSEQFHTQAETAYCGLASLVVVLNALSIDPQRTWRGPWRWFSEELLDCCTPLERVREHGISMLELACLARCNGAEALVKHPGQGTLESLREDVLRSCRATDGPFLIASYSREALGQTGSGHFSPLAAYHRATDRVLILDVARFKYPPHWVQLAELHTAMLAIDTTTQESRGWVMLQRGVRPSLVYFVSCREMSGRELMLKIQHEVPAQLTARAPSTAIEAVRVFAEVSGLGGRDAPCSLRDQDTQHPEKTIALRSAMRATRLHQVVAQTLAQPMSELVTALLLVMPDAMWSGLTPSVREELSSWIVEAWRTPELSDELSYVRQQLDEVVRHAPTA